MTQTDTANITVAAAFTSGVMPRRSSPQIWSGRVFCRPMRKNVTAISSRLRVNTSSAAAEDRGADVGEGDVPEGQPVVGVEILARLLLGPVEALEPGVDLGHHHRGEGRPVAQHHRPPRDDGKPAGEAESPTKEKKVSSATPVMMPGRMSGSRTSRSERRLAGKVEPVEHERAGHADAQAR